MRDKDRIERMTDKLKELWNKYPDQRLGQLLENYIFFGGQRGDKTSVALFHQTDYNTEKILDALLEDLD